MTQPAAASMPPAEAELGPVQDGRAQLRITGGWQIHAQLPAVEPLAARLEGATELKSLGFESGDLAAWDSGLVTYLTGLIDRCQQRGIAVDQAGLPEGIRGLLRLAYAVPERQGARRTEQSVSFVQQVGQQALALTRSTGEIMAFLGESVLAFRRLLTGQARFRKADLWLTIQESGADALPIVSLVTGQYVVALSFQPQTPLNYVGEDKTRIEIPAIEATRDRVMGMLQGLNLDDLVNTAIGTLDAVKQLVEDPALKSTVADADQALIEARKFLADLDAGVKPLLTRADNTLDDYAALAETARQRLITLADSLEKTSADIDTLVLDVDQQVGPLSKSAEGALQSVEGLIGEGSAPRYNLDLLLEEGAGAARSLRILADYLEQNPDALIRGKYGR